MVDHCVDSLGSLTQRHGVKVVKVVGHKNILAPSRMNNTIVCFFEHGRESQLCSGKKSCIL